MSKETDLSQLIKCTVISCPNYFQVGVPPKDVLFFEFPTDPETSGVWKEKCGVAAYHPTSNAKLCSQHFLPGDFEDKATLKSGAIPTQCLNWMLGLPEVRIVTSVKAAADNNMDNNNWLAEKLRKLKEEESTLQDKFMLYQDKIDNITNDILKYKNFISKAPVKRRKTKLEADLICKVFSPAQINMLMGKKKVVWSYDDMAMAFTLRHIGNKESYLYLKNTLNMPLPSLSCVQRWVASNRP